MSTKRARTEDGSASASSEEALREQVASLQAKVLQMTNQRNYFYASPYAQKSVEQTGKPFQMQKSGIPARYCQKVIEDFHVLDFSERLNTSSYVNVAFEPEEEASALLGLKVNIADQTVYPQSFLMHNNVVNALAKLWNCPMPDDFADYGCFAGAGTVGSTEACLLAGLALKFRWRKWYAEKHKLSEEQVRGLYPNLVMSDCYQACWEKFFKYMDVQPKFVKPLKGTFKVDPAELAAAVDEMTIGVVCIMGNHYGGQYDPVWDVDRALTELNAKNGWQVGIHVDAASGGFIAPFQKDLPSWDFRLPNVLSISSSGHKFGESCCGTGWVVWRRRKGLSEHVAISVTYLGGKADSYTLNFSRPASGIYVQFYKFLRLGLDGYQQLCDNMMFNAARIRAGLVAMTYKGKPRFTMLDDGDTHCLPVVTCMLNPELNLPYDDIDLQHAMAEEHWYVSGYKMSFNHPTTEKSEPLFKDAPKTQTMFRVVVKSNLTGVLVDNLLGTFKNTLEWLDTLQDNYKSRKNMKTHHSLHIGQPPC